MGGLLCGSPRFQTDRQLLLLRLPLLPGRANFLHCGLLYLLRFERVDNLRAYRIPSESSLLIPSDQLVRFTCSGRGKEAQDLAHHAITLIRLE